MTKTEFSICIKLNRKIVVYGSYEVKAPLRQRFWKKTKRTKKIEQSGKYEFSKMLGVGPLRQ